MRAPQRPEMKSRTLVITSPAKQEMLLGGRERVTVWVFFPMRKGVIGSAGELIVQPRFRLALCPHGCLSSLRYLRG